MQENLYGMRVVKSFNRQEFETKKFTDISGSIYKDFSKAEKTMAFGMPLMQFCMYACMLIICWLGARMIVASGNNELLGLTCGQLDNLFDAALNEPYDDFHDFRFHHDVKGFSRANRGGS